MATWSASTADLIGNANICAPAGDRCNVSRSYSLHNNIRRYFMSRIRSPPQLFLSKYIFFIILHCTHLFEPVCFRNVLFGFCLLNRMQRRMIFFFIICIIPSCVTKFWTGPILCIYLKKNERILWNFVHRVALGIVLSFERHKHCSFRIQNNLKWGMSLRKTNPIWPTRGAWRGLHTKIKIYFNIFQNFLFGTICYQMVRVQIYVQNKWKIWGFKFYMNGKR